MFKPNKTTMMNQTEKAEYVLNQIESDSELKEEFTANELAAAAQVAARMVETGENKMVAMTNLYCQSEGKLDRNIVDQVFSWVLV